jgi:hypothetical protein
MEHDELSMSSYSCIVMLGAEVSEAKGDGLRAVQEWDCG